MDRERIWECRWTRDISLVRQDLFYACIAQCEIVKILKENEDSDVEDMETLDEQENLQDCIRDCIRELSGIEVDDAFCNELYHEFELVNWDFLENERCDRERLADKYFLETETDYLQAEIFHYINFKRMESSEIQIALERYYKLLRHRWSDCKKTAEIIFRIMNNAIYPKDKEQYFYLFKKYNILLKYLNCKDYWDAWVVMADASCYCKDREMVVKCKKLLEQWLIEQGDSETTIKEEVQFIYVDVLIDLLDKKCDSVRYKCEKVISRLENQSEDITDQIDLTDMIQNFLIIVCTSEEYLFRWEEALLIVQKGLQLFENYEERQNNPKYWFFYLHLGYCFLMTEKEVDAYKIFDDIINGGYCKDLQMIYMAIGGISSIALIEQRYDVVCEIYKEMKKEIPETKNNAIILGAIYLNYLIVSTIDVTEFKSEDRKVYDKILGQFLKESPNDKLRYLTELVYAEYQLKLGLYDIEKIQKILEDTKRYLEKFPNDRMIRMKRNTVQGILDQKEKSERTKRTKKLSWSIIVRRWI